MRAGIGRVGVCLVCALLGCRPIPAPDDGVLSLSDVKLPSPAVVVGDTMRDSLGNATPLTLTAFGTGGLADTIQTATPEFIVLSAGAHIAPGGYLVGDSVRDTPVQVIGSVGTLQTDVASVYVTDEPDAIAASGATMVDTVVFNGADSAASVNLSQALAVKVTSSASGTAAGVAGVIVQYSIAYAPTSQGNGESGVLVSNGRAASADTTDGSGAASLQIRVRPAAPVTQPDSFVVMATAKYHGAALSGAPVRFVVPIRSVLASPDKGR